MASRNEFSYLFVVEGKDDIEKLKSFSFRFVRKTNGYGMTSLTKKFLIEANEVRTIVLLTDPDGPGRKIRDSLHSFLKDVIDIELIKKKSVAHNKVGVTEADPSYLREVLRPFMEREKKIQEEDSLTYGEFVQKGYAGADSSKKREELIWKFSLPSKTAQKIYEDLLILRKTAEDI